MGKSARKFWFWIAATMIAALPLHAQLQLTLYLDEGTAAEEELTFGSEQELRSYLHHWIDQQRTQARWEASVDTLYALDSTYWRAELYRGPAYRWIELRADSIERSWLRRAGYRPARYRDRPLDYAAWVSLRDSLVWQAAAAGYPFSKASLSDIRWAGPGQLSATLQLDTGPLVRIGEVRIPEGARVRTQFLERFLGLSEGAVYEQGRIERIPARLRQLPYLRLERPPTIRFQNDLAFVELPVQRRPASRFDFVVGVLPNSDAEGSLLITGQFHGELQNGLGAGERLAVRFERLQARTQELELAVDYPYPFELPFELGLQMELYRRDTQFLNVGWRASAGYRWRADNRISVYGSGWQTNILGVDSERFLQTGRLPDTLDLVRRQFGVQLERQRLDRRFAPRAGYRFMAGLGAGSRRIKTNSRLIELGAQPLYEELDTRGSTYQFQTEVDWYRPALWGTVLYLGLDAAGIFGEADVYPSEQFRLGGARRLRGFNEQQILASRFAIATLEWRLPLAERAYLAGFGDWAYIDGRSNALPELEADFPLGFGAGISFETRAGLFDFSLALGRRSGERIDLGAPKVHFGYLSLF